MAVKQLDSLIEREDAFTAIDDVLDAAQAGEGRALVVEAAAGLGKTALLAAARRRAAAAGMTVAHARGGELERDFPFGVVRQLLEPLVAIAGEATIAAATTQATVTASRRRGAERTITIMMMFLRGSGVACVDEREACSGPARGAARARTPTPASR